MAYKEDVLKEHGLDRETYLTGRTSYTSDNGEKIDPRELFDSITYDVSELFSEIVVRTLSKDDPKIKINFANQNFTSRVDIKAKPYAKLGRCYSIHLSDQIIELGIISVAIQTKIDIYVYFAHPGQFMHVNTKSKV